MASKVQQNIDEKYDITLPWKQHFWITTMGSLSNNKGDGNKNCY